MRKKEHRGITTSSVAQPSIKLVSLPIECVLYGVPATLQSAGTRIQQWKSSVQGALRERREIGSSCLPHGVPVRVPQQLALLVRQAALVLFDDVASKMPNRARLFEVPEKRLARELGAMALGRRPTPEQRAMDFLGEPYDLWNDAHGDPDSFIKLRLSLLELLFREAEAMLREYAPKNDVASWWSLLQKRTSPPMNAVEDALQATMAADTQLCHKPLLGDSRRSGPLFYSQDPGNPELDVNQIASR